MCSTPSDNVIENKKISKKLHKLQKFSKMKKAGKKQRTTCPKKILKAKNIFFKIQNILQKNSKICPFFC